MRINETYLYANITCNLLRIRFALQELVLKINHSITEMVPERDKEYIRLVIDAASMIDKNKSCLNRTCL